MLSIHDIRLTQNFIAFDAICKREKINFFLMLDVVKLLQSTLMYGEKFFDTRIEIKTEKERILLEYIKKNRGHLLLELNDGNDAFSVKDRTYLLLEEIYEIQILEDSKSDSYLKNKGYYKM